MMYSRREFGKATLLNLPAALVGAHLLTSGGLSAFALAPKGRSLEERIGTISYSFKELSRQVGESQWLEVLQDCHKCGLSFLELEIGKAEPIRTFLPPPRQVSTAPLPEPAAGTPYGSACVAAPRPSVPRPPAPDQAAKNEELARTREETRRFRERPPAGYFSNIRKAAAALGITTNAYTVGWSDDFTDREIDGVFLAAKDLGASAINSSTTLDMAKRLAPFANKHRMPVAFHEHLFGLFSNADDYASILALSSYYRINFDVGHFTSACGNAVAFIDRFHDKLSSVHIKDYKTSNGGSMPWGEGDAPIRQIVQALKQYSFPGIITIELDYKIPTSSDSIAEVKRCADVLRSAVQS